MSGDPAPAHRRVARDAGEPGPHAGAGSARWSDYLDWLRADLALAVLALPVERRRTSLVPSGWTPIELLSHSLHMEQRWFVWGFLGEPVAEPWGDWAVPGAAARDEAPAGRPGARWAVADDVTAEELAARLAAVGERTRAVLREHPPGAVAAVGGRFAEDPPTLEWICFHVLAEYARHLGHLDVVAEIGD